MRVDIEALKSMSAELDKKVNFLVQKIYELTGTIFNVNSTKQLGEVLLEKLKFPVIKKRKLAILHQYAFLRNYSQSFLTLKRSRLLKNCWNIAS